MADDSRPEPNGHTGPWKHEVVRVQVKNTASDVELQKDIASYLVEMQDEGWELVSTSLGVYYTNARTMWLFFKKPASTS